MISYSNSALVALALALAGCGERVVETPIVFGDLITCQAAPTYEMNTYVVTLYAYHGGAGLGTLCSECFTPGNCDVIETMCTCSPPLAVSTNELAVVMHGFRVPDVDPTTAICLRILAIDATPPPTESGPCTCPPAWQDTIDTTGRICAFTSVGTINESGTPIVVERAMCGAPGPCGHAGS